MARTSAGLCHNRSQLWSFERLEETLPEVYAKLV